MTIKDQRLVEKRIQECTDRIQTELSLEWLDVTNRFLTSRGDDGDTLCEAKTDWAYRRVSLLWNVSLVATIHDDELEGSTIHEFIHALNAPLFDEIPTHWQVKLSKLNELATENIARAISAVRSKK